jgi:acyl carrier protein
MERFYQRLAEQLQVGEVHREDMLQDFPEWDSLTILAVVAMLDAEYNVAATSDDLVKIRTAGDLEDLVRSKSRG